MKEIRISDVTAKALTGLVARQEEGVLTVGRARAFRLRFLPALRWQRVVNKAGHKRLCVNIRAIRDEATMAQIIMGNMVGVLMLGGTEAAYLVPDTEHWRKLMEGEDA